MINKQIQDLANSCLVDNISISDLINFYFYDFIQIAGDINNNIPTSNNTINEKNETLTLISELQKYYNKNIKNVDMSQDAQEIKDAQCRQIKRLVKRLIK
jgi:hypothetical protein